MSLKKSRLGDVSHLTDLHESLKLNSELALIIKLLHKLRTQEALEEKDIHIILKRVIPILQKDPPYFSIDPPVIVAGSLFGHFEDLLKIFEVGGDPPTVPYIFLGNYVDRGSHSLKVLLYLYCLKIIYPKDIFLLRGSHESLNMNIIFNFYDECLEHYTDPSVYYFIAETYKYLSIALRINIIDVS